MPGFLVFLRVYHHFFFFTSGPNTLCALPCILSPFCRLRCFPMKMFHVCHYYLLLHLVLLFFFVFIVTFLRQC